MGAMDYFKRAGGTQLLRDYSRNMLLVHAIGEALLNGLSRKSLELLRISVQNKVYRRLCKRYARLIAEFDANWQPVKDEDVPKVIWFCWFQGLGDAPLVVKRAYESYRLYMPDYKVRLITDENIGEYVDLPEHILIKYHSGMITKTHLSDILRLALLANYGGIWVDATVVCSGSDIPSYMLESDLFFFQQLKPGADGKELRLSSWYIEAKPHNRIICLAQKLLYAYWEDNTRMVDYFLFHHFLTMACSHFPDEAHSIIDASNSAPHALLLRLKEPYDEGRWNAMRNSTPFHKLTYKFDTDAAFCSCSFFERLISKGGILNYR